MDLLDSATHQWLVQSIGPRFRVSKQAYATQSEVYKILSPDEAFYLKIAAGLELERDHITALKSFARVPDVAGFRQESSRDMLLLTALAGKNLAEYIGQSSDEDIVQNFAANVRDFHALPLHKLFPDLPQAGQVVVHGDMSLPNVMYSEYGFSGYIDLASLHAGTADEDLADAIWSLQRNGLDAKYGELFLEAYGPTPMTDKLREALAFRYKS